MNVLQSSEVGTHWDELGDPASKVKQFELAPECLAFNLSNPDWLHYGR
jgi:hypothetical protein